MDLYRDDYEDSSGRVRLPDEMVAYRFGLRETPQIGINLGSDLRRVIAKSVQYKSLRFFDTS